uniref:Uncharacterized protein n=1 Tax=Anguilla anguilla TaxID=7936 RepID=A0A0E9QC31_ANGAN
MFYNPINLEKKIKTGKKCGECGSNCNQRALFPAPWHM